MSLSSVLTFGFQPAGDVNLIVSQGYALTGEPPPIPPTPTDVAPPLYGPALTPAERRRWFGADFDSPIARKAKRKAWERLKRIEIGLEDEDFADLEDRIDEKVEEVIAREEAVKPKPAKVNYDAVAERVAKKVQAEIKAEIEAFRKDRREMEEEERDAVELMMMLKDLF